MNIVEKLDLAIKSKEIGTTEGFYAVPYKGGILQKHMEAEMDKEIDMKIMSKFFNEHKDDLDNSDFINIIDDALEKNLYEESIFIFNSAKIFVPGGITTLPRKVHLVTTHSALSNILS